MSDVYRDVSRPIDERVRDLLSRMTLEEKINQMSVRTGSAESPRAAAEANNQAQREAIAQSRFGIPLLIARESSHGLNTAGVTAFPACIAQASTWDEDLVRRIGRAIADEARAQGVHQGLSPMLDIARDPRWGRMEETLGEDATLTARLGVAFIKGLQGDGDLTRGIVATPKHLVGYGAAEGGKDNDPISLTERDLAETYLPPFEAAVKEARAESIMICFGAVNGVPCTLDRRLITDLLVKQWGFDGHVIDDCPGIAGLLGHRAAGDMDEAVALGINAGIDRQFYDFVGMVPNQLAGQEKFEQIVLKLVREGRIPEARIDEAACRSLRSRFRLGLFDGDDKVFVDPAGAESVAGRPEHRALAREAAAKGIVLLKNEQDLLPLDAKKLRSIAVIGPNADEGQIGDYSGIPARIVTPLEGIGALLKDTKVEVTHVKGCEILPLAQVKGRFSVRLSGTLSVDAEEDYQLILDSNDGARLAIDNKLVIDDWTTGKRRRRQASVRLSKGEHAIVVEYFRGKAAASIDPDAVSTQGNVLRLSWATPSLGERIIPNDRFTYRGAGLGVQQHGSGEGLRMEVFLGQEFEKPLGEQSRVAREVDFDWGDRSPIVAQAAEDLESETIAAAVDAARSAEVAIVCVGETSRRGAQQVCGEHFDRSDLGLTGAQERLALAVAATGTPTVLVLVNGRSLAIPRLIGAAGAVLEAWYPGQEGGHAIADVLFGRVCPSGKLPVSIPRSAGQLPVYYNRRPRMGGYIDSLSEPLFPFGFGLSYARFDYGQPHLSPPRGSSRQVFTITIDITNRGHVAADEVVQLYAEAAACSFVTPVKRLMNFQRITLQPGETRTVTFALPAERLALLDAQLRPRLEPGEFRIQVGTSSASGSTVMLQITD